MPIVPEFSVLLTLLLCALLLLWVRKYRILAIAIFAFSWVLLAGQQYLTRISTNNINIALLHKQAYLVQGQVENIVQTKAGTSRFNFKISHWQGQKLAKTFIVRLTWQQPTQHLLQGQRWQLLVKLKPAHGLANTGGFNYQTWLLQQQIVATGYVKNDAKAKSVSAKVMHNKQLKGQVSWRQLLYQQLSLLLTDEPLSGLILALGFGERGELSRHHWQVLSATATQHLIAISGLHIGIVAMATLIVMRAVVCYLPWYRLLSKPWQIKLTSRNITFLPVLISGVMAWYYAYLAGFAIPTLRALIMLLLFWLCKAMAIKMTLMRWLLSAIVAILLCWPLSLLSASFWLSIIALTIIFITITRYKAFLTGTGTDTITAPSSIAATTKLQSVVKVKYLPIKMRAVNWLKGLLLIQLVLTLAMLPIAALLNYQLPLAAFFANIVAVPVMSITVIPCTLLAVIALPLSKIVAMFFLDLALFFLAKVWQYLSVIASVQWLQLPVSFQQIQLLLLVLVLCLGAIFFRVGYAKRLLLSSMLLLALGRSHLLTKQSSDWQLTVLDAGHGLAIVIEKDEGVFLYDTGASYASGFSIADAALIPYLKHRGFNKIDGVIISHNDNDHAGGLAQLRKQLSIAKVIANDFALLPDSVCLAGQGFDWQGLRFEMLSPSVIKGDKNDDSCVLTISDGLHKVLLPGDISIKQERQLLAMPGMREKLRSDLLIAPHHGSKSSSSARFLSAVAPQYAVFSTGYLNRWQMPSKEIINRYQALTTTMFNTAEQGMISFTFRLASPSQVSGFEQDIETKSYRADRRQYWYVNSY
ncbi:DNA internalization-related competence protein ComEC/Rec2 [Colwellia chukchiensis]|nr:DNA internalization-related competence protein ComEC/Rec2 [Colwellia chukchiensis]